MTFLLIRNDMYRVSKRKISVFYSFFLDSFFSAIAIIGSFEISFITVPSLLLREALSKTEDSLDNC